MQKTRSQGFTLIELLVVIAIIGILSAVVLASLGTARNKAKDASIQESLSSARTQAEVYYSSATNYGTGYTSLTTATAAAGVDITPSSSCATSYATNGGMFTTAASSNGLDALIKAMCTNGATAITASVDAATAAKWALKATGNGTSPTYYCVDSNGTSKTYAAAPTLASAACP